MSQWFDLSCSGQRLEQCRCFFNHVRRYAMSNAHVYKKIELVGSSTKSSDDAIQQAIARASETLRNLDWFEVVETRGHIQNGKIAHWQVTLRIGIRLEAEG